ncbi:MAG: NADPH-dependent FMN reductase [Acidimicrobiia bacterium]
MSATPRIALVIGSTRPTRFADKPADWLLEVAAGRDDLTLEKVDLRDHPLPFFAEVGSNLHVPSQDPAVLAWQDAVRPYDGYVFVTAEYNHSITGALKNALDQAYVEWVRKPMSALSYGGSGGVRAVEHLRGIAVELQMAPVRAAVAIGGSELIKVHPFGGNAPMSEIDDILRPTAEAMFDDLVWWAEALRPARTATAA